MAVSYKVLKYSALCQTSLGIFLMVLGCIDRSYIYRSYPTFAVLPIWMGFLIAVTGFFGMGIGYGRPDGPKIPVLSRAVGKTKKSNYLGLSMVSCVFAGSMVVLYSHGISLSSTCPEGTSTIKGQRNEHCHISHVVGSIIIVIAIVEFGASIWACVCCCYRSHRTLLQGQTVFIQNQHGQATSYIIDVIDAEGRAVVFRNPIEVLGSNPIGEQGLCNDGFVLGPPPPYKVSEDINEEERADPLPNAQELPG